MVVGADGVDGWSGARRDGKDADDESMKHSWMTTIADDGFGRDARVARGARARRRALSVAGRLGKQTMELVEMHNRANANNDDGGDGWRR